MMRSQNGCRRHNQPYSYLLGREDPRSPVELRTIAAGIFAAGRAPKQSSDEELILEYDVSKFRIAVDTSQTAGEARSFPSKDP